jgi:phthalate 4,5-cis-dihydrodiol dehydrogenase
MHTEHVLLAIANGKHVLVAKPMAVDLQNAQVMLNASTKAGVALVEAHPQSMEQAVLGMRSVVESGELGQLRMVHNWHYGSWLYQPRLPEELDTKLGGGATFRQGAHQFDILRLIGGGLVRSVRAMTGVWDSERATEGAHAAFLDFEDGTVATAVFSGYDHFPSSELTYGLGQGGTVESGEYGAARKARQVRKADDSDDVALKKLRGYGESSPPRRASGERHQPTYGLTLMSCDEGDVRQSQDGLLIYGSDAKREVKLDPGRTGRDAVLDEIVNAATGEAPAIHDGAWSLATLELTLAVLESGRSRSEVYLKRQVPLPRTVADF